ncbi:hypothetical protein BKH46_07895 [Helicobacter sp. 12S02634-8]|uniref:hypothetical protein n=1 Tax=Helicobacter sp. 12S02634-8 TaxID=1476199 RepID=UPI000BA6BB75|nr:hypothetical protein [Helicobacter sp. 12S02634-8]PAF46381.1 hypothetical protein BKH46_07895 [Helicobacter sp. 12S02634-8]
MFSRLKGLIFCLFLPISLLAQSFVLHNQTGLLLPKAALLVQAVSHELYAKTGFSFYIDMVDTHPLNTKQERKAYESDVASKLSSPYAVLFFFREAKKIEIILSPNAQNLFDINQMYFDYIAPLLPEKDTDLTPERISAFLINGYSEIADRIADGYGIKLENNFPPDNQNQFVRVILYLMLISLVGLFVVVYFFKGKNKGKK